LCANIYPTETENRNSLLMLFQWRRGESSL